MKVSIAMATYNGRRYLLPQLQSLAYQSKLPDELVVCDDASNDGTPELISEFAKLAPFEVKLYINDKNLGFIKNFEKAIDRSEGDLIFLCDQDDRWYEKKIARIYELFRANEKLLLTVNDQRIVDANLTATNFTSMGNTEVAYGSLERFVSGCCSAFRSCLKDVLLPLPDDTVPHDIWLHEIVGTLNGRLEVREVLQDYRRHDAVVSDWRITSLEPMRPKRSLIRLALNVDSRVGYERQLKRDQALLERLMALRSDAELVSRCAVPTSATKLRNRIAAFGARKELLTSDPISRRWKAVAMLVRGQYRHFRGWRSFVKDILRPSYSAGA